eukprot:2247031-Rhodomonas_salina.1
MDYYMEAWGDAMNKTAVCRNCDEKGKHSAPFCSKPRREDLPCQLCLGRHTELTCVGPGHVTTEMWKVMVRDPFLKRIG